MKRRDFLVGIGSAGLLAGCGKFNIKDLGEGDTSILAIYAAETAAVPVGYFAAQLPVADKALRGAYDLAVKGELTPEAINIILTTLGTGDPIAVLLVRRAVRLAELAGASVGDGGTIIGLTGLDPRLVEAIGHGYVEGYDTFMLTQNARWKRKTIHSPQV